MNNGDDLLYLQSLLFNGRPSYRIQHCQAHLKQSGGRHVKVPRKELYRTSNNWDFRGSDKMSELYSTPESQKMGTATCH